LALKDKVAAELELMVVRMEKDLLEKKESSCREDLKQVRVAKVSSERRLLDIQVDLETCSRQRNMFRLKQRRLDWKQAQQSHKLEGCFQDLKTCFSSKSDVEKTAQKWRVKQDELWQKQHDIQVQIEKDLASWELAHFRLSSDLRDKTASVCRFRLALIIVSCLLVVSIAFHVCFCLCFKGLQRELSFFGDAVPRILEQNERLCNLLDRYRNGKLFS